MSNHKLISWIKSAVRILGCGIGMIHYAAYAPNVRVWVPGTVRVAFLVLLIAEIVGIIEEVFE
jgi:hypothetical protein